MNTNSTPATATSPATPVAPQADPASGLSSREVKSALWFGLGLAVIVALYVVTERSIWFQELPAVVGAPGRIAAVAVLLGLFSTLNPWAPAQGSRG